MVYIFYADGFEEIEGLAPLDILRRADIEVRSVGIGSKMITGSHGIKIECDSADFEQFELDSIDAVILPGGAAGTANLERSALVNAALDYAERKEKLICAICAAPSILAHKGMLRGIKSTVYPTFKKELAGAVLSDMPVVNDKNFITAKGAGVSLEFAFEIVEYLCGKEKADEIAGSIQF